MAYRKKEEKKYSKEISFVLSMQTKLHVRPKKDKKNSKECLSFLMVLFTEYSCTQRIKQDGKKRERKEIGNDHSCIISFPRQPASKERNLCEEKCFFLFSHSNPIRKTPRPNPTRLWRLIKKVFFPPQRFLPHQAGLILINLSVCRGRRGRSRYRLDRLPRRSMRKN